MLIASAGYAQRNHAVVKVKFDTNLSSVVARGWTLVDSVFEDWNGDGIDDVALVAEHENTDNADEESLGTREDSSGWRRLSVLLVDREGKPRVIGFSDDAIICATCGGLKSSWSVSALNGSLFVYSMSGSSMFVERTAQFRYDSSARRMRLIGLEVINHNGMTGATVNESTNLLAGKREITLHQFRHRRSVIVSRRSETFRSGNWYLEDVGRGRANDPLEWTSEEASQLLHDK